MADEARVCERQAMAKLQWRSDTESAVRTAVEEYADGLYANARAMEERAGIIDWLGRAFQVELPGMPWSEP